MADSQERRLKIHTFVFFDIETTGIDRDSRILELSMIAVSRNDLLSMMENKLMSSSGKCKIAHTPRVLHKYTSLYYPRRQIFPGVEEITGLSNDCLHHLASFNGESASAIEIFLNLPPPVCLVAHNGNSHDFPILKAEFLEVNKDNLKEIVCVDSLLFVRNYESEEVKLMAELAIDFKDSDFEDMNSCPKSENCELKMAETYGMSPGYDVLNSSGCSSHNIFVTPPKVIPIDFTGKFLKTPKKSNYFCNNKILTSETNLKEKNNSRNILATNKNVKRALYIQKTPNYKKPFSQPTLYYRLFGKHYKAHTAESDALALMHICGFYGKEFVDWADRNFTEFKAVIPKWKTRNSNYI